MRRVLVGRRLLSLSTVALLTALIGCGEGSSKSEGGGRADLEHIHGLGVNPKDGALFIATHFGLFRAGEGEQTPERVGESRQDVMGFSMLGSDRFLGSGHPAPDQAAPPNLGLIRSDDGGRSWSSVSLSGEADFHVLRSAGQRVYGFDAGNARFLVSANAGRDWQELELPDLMIDLAIDPTAATHLVTATESGLYRSANGGKNWRLLTDETAGLLAWSREGALYLLDGVGDVQRSKDGGKRWKKVGSIGGQPVAFASAGEHDLYAALPDGTVKRSINGGRSWSVRAAP